MNPILTVEGVTAGYGRVTVLHDISLEAGRFEAVSTARAERALCDAEDFVDVARTAATAGDWPGEAVSPGLGPRMLAVRAS